MSHHGFKAISAQQLLSALAIVLCMRADLRAQNDSGRAGAVQHRNDCRLAEQVLLHGRPANKRPWALGIFTTCPSGSRIAARLVARMGTESPERLEEVVAAVSGFVDREVTAAALAVALDPGASTTLRVHAMRILYAQAIPGFPIAYSSITAEPRAVVDSASSTVTVATHPPDPFVTDVPVVIGAQLSQPEMEQVRQRMMELARDTGIPQPVRIAAARVASAFRARRLCSTGTPFSECRDSLRGRGP